MKHLKLFEAFGLRQPTKLSYQEGMEWGTNHEKAEWDESESHFYNTLTKVNAKLIYDSVMWETLMRFYLYPVVDSDEFDHLEIEKYDDSYYLIWYEPAMHDSAETRGSYYRCDEWEEVLGFLGRYTTFRF